jgi:hypothetical protein
MSKNVSVYGIFRDRAHVEQALTLFRGYGFRPEDVSVLMQQNLGNKDLSVEKATKAPEGAVAGGAAGAATGGVVGWLVGIGALAIPGVGPLIAAGPIMAALAGMGAGAALGGATGALVGTGIPEYEAQRYEGRVREGGILVSVHCDDNEWKDRATAVMEEAGAEDISSSGQAKADYAASEKPVPRMAR